jgi:cell division protein ZapA
MSTPANQLDIVLLGRDYRIACPPEEQPALRAAVAYLDGKMQEIVGKSRAPSGEKVAVMAALNITHELLAARQQPASTGSITSALSPAEGFDSHDVQRRMTHMEAQLDALLNSQPAATLF